MPVLSEDNAFETVALSGAPDQHKVMQFANQISATVPPDSMQVAERSQTLQSSIFRNVQQDNPDYTSAIRELHELRDAKNGIAWQQQGNVLVRDARLQEGPGVDGPEAYQMMSLNYARAATILLEDAKERGGITSEQQQEAVKSIQRHTYESFQQLARSDNPEEDFKRRNTQLVDYLAEGLGVGHKAASKQLNLAKDFAGFEDRHVNTVTLSTVVHEGKRYTVCEAETMLTGMSEAQKQEFANRQDKAWYQAQEPFAKSLIDRYTPQITDDAHTIPTQLRAIPGIRNAYTKTTALAPERGELMVVHEGHHSGTVASQARGGSEEQQRLATQNVEQLSNVIGKPIHMVTLNSPNNPTGNDSSIVEQTGQATAAGQGTHTNLAFNFLRRFIGANKTDGLTQLLNETSNYAADQGKPAIAEYINGRSSDINAAREELADCKGSSKRMFTAALEAKETLSKNTGIRSLFDSGNRNLSITSNLSIIRHEMRDEVHGERFNAIPEEVSACQSGKDRNGLKLFNTSVEAISSALRELTGTAADKEAVRTQMANAGHTQNQAGNQGGTPGCFGIKGDTKGAIPEQWENGTKGILVQKTASFNGKIKEYKASFVEKLRNLFSPSSRAPEPREREYNVIAPQEAVSVDALKDIDVSIGRESSFAFEGPDRRTDKGYRKVVGEDVILTEAQRKSVREAQVVARGKGEELASGNVRENTSQTKDPLTNNIVVKQRSKEVAL